MSRHTHCALIFAAVAVVFGVASPAFGHAAVTDTSPSNRSSVSEITEVSVTANEELLDIGDDGAGFVITVRDEDDHFYGDGCVEVNGDTASMPIALTAAGKYEVDYRIVSNDGHPIEGSFSFRFDGIDGAEPAPAFAKRTRCGIPQEPIPATVPPAEESTPVEESPAADPSTPSNDFDVTPWIGLAGVVLVGGGIWVLFRALGRSDSEDDRV